MANAAVLKAAAYALAMLRLSPSGWGGYLRDGMTGVWTLKWVCFLCCKGRQSDSCHCAIVQGWAEVTSEPELRVNVGIAG